MNTKQYVIISILIFTINLLSAQSFDWVKKVGSYNNNEFGNSLTIDNSGNIITIGNFAGTVDFNPDTGAYNLTSNGNYDIFIQKLDASGNFLWALSFGGTQEDDGRSITSDNNGNIIVTGSFKGLVDFNPDTATYNLTGSGNSGCYILKLDSMGNFIWANAFSSNGYEIGKDVAVDRNGNIYTTGIFYNTIDFDPGPGVNNKTSVGNADVFIQKLDSNGNLIWVKTFGGTYSDMGVSIDIDSIGNVYTLGDFKSNVDFNPGNGINSFNSNGNYDIFLNKLDSSGNFVWNKTFGGQYNDGGSSISLDRFGNIILTGYYNSSVDFNPNAGTFILSSVNITDAFVQKLSTDGSFIWAKSIGGNDYDFGVSVTSDKSGNIYTTGTFNLTVDFNPNSGTFNKTSFGNRDVFIHKMDSNGNYIWVQTIGGTDEDNSSSITLDKYNNIYTLGYFKGTVDFDPDTGITNVSSSGYNDIFLHKINQCSDTYSTDSITACDSLLWLDGNTYYSNNDTSTFSLLNATGCDSIISLNLSINYSNSITDSIVACDYLTWIDGNTYYSNNDSATYILTNSFGCDSIIKLDLTINTVDDISTTKSNDTIYANNSNAIYQWLDCDNNFIEIANETNQMFIVTANGSYAVELTEHGCVDTSICTSVNNIGIKESRFDENILIYPNPNKGNFNIDLGKVYKSAKVEISNIYGKLIYAESISNKQLISLSINQTFGVYLITITADERRAVFKLIKE